MPGTCNERSIDLSVSATGFSPIEAYFQTDRRTLADFTYQSTSQKVSLEDVAAITFSQEPSLGRVRARMRRLYK